MINQILTWGIFRIRRDYFFFLLQQMGEGRVVDQIWVVVTGRVLVAGGCHGNLGVGRRCRGQEFAARRHGDGLFEGKHLVEGKVLAVDGLQLLLKLDLFLIVGISPV